MSDSSDNTFSPATNSSDYTSADSGTRNSSILSTRSRGRSATRSSRSSKSSRSGSSAGPSSRRRFRRKRRTSHPATRSSRSQSRSRSSRHPSGLAVTEFKPCQDAQTSEEMRGFLRDYAKSEQFESFTLKIDGIPFAAVSLLNADQELRAKFWSMPPPTPMRPSRNSENRPRKRSLSSNLSSSSGRKSRKSVRFPDEKISGEDVERVLDGIVKQRKSYSDLWADREQ